MCPKNHVRPQKSHAIRIRKFATVFIIFPLFPVIWLSKKMFVWITYLVGCTQNAVVLYGSFLSYTYPIINPSLAWLIHSFLLPLSFFSIWIFSHNFFEHFFICYHIYPAYLEHNFYSPIFWNVLFSFADRPYFTSMQQLYSELTFLADFSFFFRLMFLVIKRPFYYSNTISARHLVLVAF